MKQQNQPSAPEQVVYVVQEPRRGKVDKKAIKDAYNAKATTVLGIAHIICGIIAFSCEIDLVVSLSGPRLTVGAGIWSSVFFFISGGLAIGGALSGRKCLVVATMVMAIISAVCAGVLLIMSAILFEHNTRVPLPFGKSIDALYTLLIAMGATMLIVAIISAALTCRPLCCLQPNHLNYYQPIQTNNQLHQANQLHYNQPSWFDPGHYEPSQVYDQANQANNLYHGQPIYVQNQPNYVSNQPNQSNWAQVHYQPNQVITTHIGLNNKQHCVNLRQNHIYGLYFTFRANLKLLIGSISSATAATLLYMSRVLSTFSRIRCKG